MTLQADPALYGAPELNRIMTEAQIPDLPAPTINVHVRQGEWVTLHAALDVTLARLIDVQVELPLGTIAALLDLHRYVGVEEATGIGDARCRVRVAPLLAYLDQYEYSRVADQLRRDMAT